MDVPSYVMPTARAIWGVSALRPKLNGFRPEGTAWVFIDDAQTTLKRDRVSLIAAMTSAPAEFFCVFKQVNTGGAEYIVPRFDVKIPWNVLRARELSTQSVLRLLEQAGFGAGKMALRKDDQTCAIFETTQYRELSHDEIASGRWSLWYRDRITWAVAAMEQLFGAEGSVS